MQDELVEQAQRGDAEAFDSLARLVGDRCLAIAVRILRDIDLAEDAVQFAFKAWTELRTLLRILPVTGAYGPDEYLTVDDRDLLERAFRRLTVEQRAVLVFHHYLGLSIAQVADRIGIPVGTAKSRLHHASRALRTSIEADARATADTQERLA